MFFKIITCLPLLFCSLSQAFAQEEEKLSIYSFSIATPTNSNLIVTTPDRSYFKVWDLSKGLVMREYTIEGRLQDFHTHNYGVALALFVKGENNYEIWDTEKGQIIKHFNTLNNEKNPVEVVALAPNMRFIVYTDTTSYTAKVWDIEQNRLMHTFFDKSSYVVGLEVSPNSRWIISRLLMLDIGIIDVNIKQRRRFKDDDSERSPCGTFHGSSFSADGQWFGAVGDEAYAKIVSTQTGKSVFDLEKLLYDADFNVGVGRTILISPNKQKILVGNDSELAIIDVSSKKVKQLQDSTLFESALSITANSKYILSANAGIVRAYDINTGKLYLSFLHTTEGTIVFDPAGAYWTSGKALAQIQSQHIMLNLRGKNKTTMYLYTDENFRSYQPQVIAQKMLRLAK